jgi:hypothetical protein
MSWAMQGLREPALSVKGCGLLLLNHIRVSVYVRLFNITAGLINSTPAEGDATMAVVLE